MANAAWLFRSISMAKFVDASNAVPRSGFFPGDIKAGSNRNSRFGWNICCFLPDNATFHYLHIGLHFPEIVGKFPAGRAFLPFQQSGGCQQECTYTKGGNLGPFPVLVQYPGYEGPVFRYRFLHVSGECRDNDQIRLIDFLQWFIRVYGKHSPVQLHFLFTPTS